MPGYRINSSDNHIAEPPDLWTGRIDAKFKDRAPHLVREDGVDFWYCDGVPCGSVVGGTMTGTRFEVQDELARSNREVFPDIDVFENTRPGGYIPEECIKDMDADGVYAGVIYPTTGTGLYMRVEDSELFSACCRAYNDWLAEFCRPFPNRLKGNAMLNIDDVAEGVREMERCAKMGLAGIIIPVYPPLGREYDSPEYEPLWAAAEDLGIPIGWHTAIHRMSDNTDRSRASYSVNRDHWVRMSLADIIAGGVFERHPKLYVGAVENGLSWAAHFVEMLDYIYTQRTRSDDWPRYGEDVLPSYYFKRNVFLSFQEDALGVRLRDITGVDNLIWGSDYPHREGTFPKTQETLEEILADCTEEEKVKIAGANCARIYHID